MKSATDDRPITGTARVSVIVPLHNYARFLPEAIESLDRQDRAPDEVLICDDASTDDGLAVAESLATQRPNVRILRNETNRGLIGTINRLVHESTGDIIIPFSSDDRLGASYVRRMEEAILQNGWDFAYSDYELFGSEEGYVRVPDFDPGLLLRVNYIAGTSAFTRQLFDDVGGYNKDFDAIGLEDWDFWLSAFGAGFVGGRADLCSFDWRRHETGSRNTINARQRMGVRLTLIRRHYRLYLHPRSLEFLSRYVRGGTTSVG
ncbi:MAG: glycosyltransferase involved in cell wall biosynthesis [Verrucomicrobiales bacterium]|jgi:glycosyltransferase involved in cell wall biosynthesis